jgi:hypothetical protein
VLLMHQQQQHGQGVLLLCCGWLVMLLMVLAAVSRLLAGQQCMAPAPAQHMQPGVCSRCLLVPCCSM